jgi:hypothetical protein
MDKEIPIPDQDLTEDQKELVAKLTDEDLKEIDEMLISAATNKYRKVAMLVGSTMMNLPNRVKGIPDVFYSQRVRKLVEDGQLEYRGNLQYMRFSEVKLSSQKISANET